VSKWLGALLLLLAGGPAFAYAPDYPAVFKEAMFNNSGGKYTYWPDPQEACIWSTGSNPISSSSSVASAVFTLEGERNLSASYVCTWTYKTGGTNVVSRSIRFHCPYGGTLNGSLCVKVPDGQGEPKLCDDKNPFIRRWNYPGAGPYPAPSHYNGCVVVPLEMMVCRKEGTASYCMWMVKRTGEVYTGAPDTPGTGASDTPDNPDAPPTKSPPIVNPPAPDAPPGSAPCPTGTVHAGTSADGVPICMGTGSSPQNPPAPPPRIESSKSEDLPDGSTKKTDTVTQTNSDGSTTTTTTVTITRPDGTKETSGGTVTSKTPSGMAGRTDTPENDKYDLCKTNPNLSICRESSVSGTCGEVVCMGDAIQCATLRAAAAMECRQKQDREELQVRPEVALGDQILAGADPMKGQIDEALNGGPVADFSAPGLDQSGFLGAGSCLASKSFSAFGRTVQLDTAVLCADIEPLKYVILAVSFLAAYMIISKAVLEA